MSRLTERQKELVAFVTEWWAAHGYGPSMRDIAAGLIISRQTAVRQVRVLVAKGVLAYTPGVCRSVRIVTKGTLPNDIGDE